METVKYSGPWSSLGSHGQYVFTLVVCAYLSSGETGHDEILTFWVKFDLEIQFQSFPKTTEVLTKVFFTSGLN